MLSIILSVIKFLAFVLVPLWFLVLIVMCRIFIGLISGHRFKPSKSKYKKRSVMKRLFIDFPKQFVTDMFNRDPNDFQEHGLHMFCGEQGSGKTVSVTHYLQMMKERYPECKIRTNFNYLYQDAEVRSWRDIVQNDNGTKGQIEVIDEIQTWFNSLQSKDFPPEMLGEISQQRKQRKMIIGTAQVFSRIAKPIREQTTYVYCPITVFGCFTLVRKTKPEYYDDEKFKFTKFIKTYFFIHNEKIRNSFDTYKKIETMSIEGFSVRPELYDKSSKTIINVTK